MFDWLSLYSRGFIPGPSETEEDFRKRIFAPTTPLHKEAQAITWNVFRLAPDWISIELSKKGLRPWEAGAAWQDDQQSWHIQIHPKWKAQDEVMAHEAIHVVRGAFQEKIFEEILAFRTSKSRLRKFLGPLFRTTKEPWILLAACGIDCGWAFVGGTPCATLLLLFMGILRLSWNQCQFARCQKFLPHPALVIGLTDREIRELARGKSFSSLNDGSLRWQSLTACANALSEAASPVGI
jgi:hypothetical protein